MGTQFYDRVVYRPEYNYSFSYFQNRIDQIIGAYTGSDFVSDPDNIVELYDAMQYISQIDNDGCITAEKVTNYKEKLHNCVCQLETA